MIGPDAATLIRQGEDQVEAAVAAAIVESERVARDDLVVSLNNQVLDGLSFDQTATVLAITTVLLIEARAEAARGERYRLAWQSARQRAANHLAALVEADEERDALRAELRTRDGAS